MYFGVFGVITSRASSSFQLLFPYDGSLQMVKFADGRELPVTRRTELIWVTLKTARAPAGVRLHFAIMSGGDDVVAPGRNTLRVKQTMTSCADYVRRLEVMPHRS